MDRDDKNVMTGKIVHNGRIYDVFNNIVLVRRDKIVCDDISGEKNSRTNIDELANKEKEVFDVTPMARDFFTDYNNLSNNMYINVSTI